MDRKLVSWGTMALGLSIMLPVVHSVDRAWTTPPPAYEPDIIAGMGLMFRDAFTHLSLVWWLGVIAAWVTGTGLLGAGLLRRAPDGTK